MPDLPALANSRRPLLAVLLVAAMLASLVVVIQPAQAQSMSLSPSAGLGDELPLEVTVDLSGFFSGQPVGVFFEPLGEDPATDEPDPESLVDSGETSSADNGGGGEIQLTFEVEDGTPLGEYRVLACLLTTSDGDTCAPQVTVGFLTPQQFLSSTFQVFAIRGIEVSPSQGFAGSSAVVSGFGFRTSSFSDSTFDPGCPAVGLDFEGIDIGSSEIERSTDDPDRDHTLSHSFTVPDVDPGTYTITATQGTVGSDVCPVESHTTTFQVVEVPPEPDPQIEVDPSSGIAGSTTTATVSGFGESFECGPVTVTFDGEEVLEEMAATTATFWEAGFTESFTVPDRSPGTYDVTATQTGCGPLSASTSFTVVVAFDPTLTVDPEEGTVESEVEASGEDFEPAVPVVLRLGETLVAIVSGADVNGAGAFTVTFEVPEVTPGGIQDVIACQRCTSTDVLEATAEFLVLPRIFIDRQVARPGNVIEVTGDGFPTDEPVTLSWDRGIGLETVQGDEDGEISTLMLIFRRDIVGPRELIAEIVDEDLEEDEEPITATEELLVGPGTLSPPDFVRRG